MLCDGLASCYWCEKNKDSIPLTKPYCAASERCFRGKESNAQPNEGKGAGEERFYLETLVLFCFILLASPY